MAYNQTKDKVMKVLTYEYEGGSLLFAIISYDGGEAKLQISRTYNKKNDEIGYAKIGRLTKEETQFFLDNAEELVDNMKGD